MQLYKKKIIQNLYLNLMSVSTFFIVSLVVIALNTADTNMVYGR